MTDAQASQELRPAKWLDRSSPPHLLSLVLIAGLGALCMNIFLPSLPSMARFFAADYTVMQLAVSAYLAATAVLQLMIGPLSDRYGRRPVLLVCLVIFLGATFVCTQTDDVLIFLIFRMVQATVASGFVLSRAIVRDMVSAEKAASMIGYVTMGMAVVPMIGPMIGGILDELFGWQASFIALFAFGLLVLCVAWLDLGETNTHRSASFSAQVRTYPELLRSRRFWGYTLVASAASGAFFAFLGGGPWVATEVLGMSPGQLGTYFAFIAGGYMVGNFISGMISERMGINPMMLMGACIACAGLVLAICLFLAGLGSPLALFGTTGLVGLGNGMLLPSANAGMVSVRPHLAGSASGLGGAMMIGGGAAISAITGLLMGPETGAYPLLLMMLASSALSILGALYVIKVASQVESEQS